MGLTELGHEVFYLLPKGAEAPLPQGVTLLSKPITDVDVFHTMTFRDAELVRWIEDARKPWVATCHLDPTVPGRTLPDPIRDNWIFVSRTLARSLGKNRYVRNGINPREFVFSESKDNYYLFIASLEWAYHKGLDTALHLAKLRGFKLVVAGTGKTNKVIEETAKLCAAAGADFVGDVRGAEKANLLAGARALLFPTRVNEAFGLVMAEALMSGTPVICSDKGACPELISPEIGFVCATERDYAEAFERIDEIDPQACRSKAMADYHYLRMTKDYVREYAKEVTGSAGSDHSSGRLQH
jgi:glycosyltransferase involved in cell wall biosynthesis